MSNIVDCPQCKRLLRLPDELLGQKVQCPACAVTFTAALAPGRAAAPDLPAPTPEPSRPAGGDSPDGLSLEHDPVDQPAQPAGQPRPGVVEASPEAPAPNTRDETCPYCGEPVAAGADRCHSCGEYLEDEEDDRGDWDRRLRRDLEPHRGPTVLALGIVSLVTAATCFLSPVGLVLGIIAWVMGQGDLRKIRARAMDPQGHGSTQGGWICGIIGTFLSALMLLSCVGMQSATLFSGASSRPPPPVAAAPVPVPGPPQMMRPEIVAIQPVPDSQIKNEDYARARSNFRTQLLKHEGSPQEWQRLVAPPGVREVWYRSEGLMLRAWVSEPPAGKKGPLPAVIYLHNGYAFGRDAIGGDDWEASRPYRDAGYIVMTPMLRGENGQAGAWSKFYSEVDDVLGAAEALAKLPYVDGKHLYLAGDVEGGTLALLTAETSNRFRAAAAFSPYPFLVRRGDEPFDPGDNREMQMRSPLYYIKSLKCPTRIYYHLTGGYPPATYDQLTRFGREGGQDVQAVRLEGNSTSILLPGMKQSIDFFRQHK